MRYISQSVAFYLKLTNAITPYKVERDDRVRSQVQVSPCGRGRRAIVGSTKEEKTNEKDKLQAFL